MSLSKQQSLILQYIVINEISRCSSEQLRYDKHSLEYQDYEINIHTLENILKELEND